MSASNEWYEFHLTPNGWVDGSKKQDFAGENKAPVPPDRVMTVRCREYQSCLIAKTEFSRSVVWRSTDSQVVEQLVEQYGECPKKYIHWAKED